MKMLIALLGTVTVLLNGCAALDSQPQPRGLQSYTLDCKAQAKQQATLTYGETELRLVPKLVQVPKNEYFVIKLVPLEGAKNKSVLIDGEGVDTDWIYGEGNVGHKGIDFIEICVPSDIVPATYKYSVIVPNVGLLDPHVKVVE